MRSGQTRSHPPLPAPPPRSSGALHVSVGPVHAEHQVVVAVPIELVDGRLGLRLGGERDEPEAPRLARVLRDRAARVWMWAIACPQATGHGPAPATAPPLALSVAMCARSTVPNGRHSSLRSSTSVSSDRLVMRMPHSSRWRLSSRSSCAADLPPRMCGGTNLVPPGPIIGPGESSSGGSSGMSAPAHATRPFMRSRAPFAAPPPPRALPRTHPTPAAAASPSSAARASP